MADIEIRQALPTAFYIKVHDTDNVAIIVNDNGLKAGTRFPQINLKRRLRRTRFRLDAGPHWQTQSAPKCWVWRGSTGWCWMASMRRTSNLNLVRRKRRFKFIWEDSVIHRIYLFNSAALVSIFITSVIFILYFGVIKSSFSIIATFRQHIVLMLKCYALFQ